MMLAMRNSPPSAYECGKQASCVKFCIYSTSFSKVMVKHRSEVTILATGLEIMSKNLGYKGLKEIQEMQYIHSHS